jgi:predicted DCC family thiol-disulfide oxidoreductase YuxK
MAMKVTDLGNLGGRLLVIFDGHCGFCNGTVRWFLRRDRLDRLRFVPSESPAIAAFMERHRFAPLDSPADPDTIVVVRDPGGLEEQVFLRSDAAIALFLSLPRPWPRIAKVFRSIPSSLRDLAYRLIARWRYRIWGRLDRCPLPTPEERFHFL